MFNTAISGLRAASTDLEVIGNNVANVSSTGFKSSRALFADMYSASPSPTHSIGLGVKSAGIDQEFTQGSITITDNSLDMAIDGQGFFGMSDGGSMVYTRAGAFKTDLNGYVVNHAGHRLMGYQADGQGGVTSQLGELRIDTSNMQPSATGQVSASFNLDAGAVPPERDWADNLPLDFGGSGPAPDTYNSSTSLTIHDSLGNPHTMTLYLVKTDTARTWNVHTLIDGVVVGGTNQLVFDENGLIDPGSGMPEFNLSGWDPLDANGNPNGAAQQAFDVSLLEATQFGTPFVVHSLTQDGYSAGEFQRIAIDPTGVITSHFSNGQSKALGQVALYNFANPQGLQQLGDSAWGETPSSGQAVVGAPGTGTLGSVQSGALEESNVDLTAELADLILAQRNYQANAKTIQTADTITQTIINLR